LEEGKNGKINATFIPVFSTDDTTLFYESSDPDIVYVDEEGNIEAIMSGIADITVTDASGNFSVVCAIIVETPAPTPNPDAGLQLDITEAELNVDDELRLQASYVPKYEQDDQTLIWSSEDPRIATVDSQGNVKGISTGETRIVCASSDGEFKAYCDVTVQLQWKNYTYEFTNDLSAYEWAMNPQSDAYVFLVNRNNPLDENYSINDLTDVRDTRKDGRAPLQLRKIAEAALHALFIEAESHGALYVNEKFNASLSATSTYRSYAQQEKIFNDKVNSLMSSNPNYTREEAEAIASESINLPGTSEHHTGLCVDMHNLKLAERELAIEFGESVAGKWLAENCYKFGYILRYEADKTPITGILYESWHFRYVGRYHATRMHELDMCLEEYTEYLNEMGYEFNLAE